MVFTQGPWLYPCLRRRPSLCVWPCPPRHPVSRLGGDDLSNADFQSFAPRAGLPCRDACKGSACRSGEEWEEWEG